MALGLLDLNDCNLVLWHGQSTVQSPGYALLRGNDYVFGAAARAAARVEPRNINTRYWWQLSTEKLQPALGPARHTGDLAHAHLNALHAAAKEPAELIFAVSGSMQREQLALLLGIAQQCPFNAVGLVNRSVLLGSLCAGAAQFWHLEVQLHQSLLSRLVNENGQTALAEQTALPGCGLLQLQERIVEIIAAAFVRQTRFDPRRKASTEQALYDVLPGALTTLQNSSEANVEVDGYRARIVRGELEGAAAQLVASVREVQQGSDALLLADPLAALLPGFASALPALRILEREAIRGALDAHCDTIVQRDTALHYLTTLPDLAPHREAPTPPGRPGAGDEASPTSNPEPTHVLSGSEAQPLAAGGTPLANGWQLQRLDGSWLLRGGDGDALVNHLPSNSDTALSSGDRIDISGAVFTLITVRS